MYPRIALLSELGGFPDCFQGVHTMISLGHRRSARHAIILTVLFIIFLSAFHTAPASSSTKKLYSPKRHSPPKRSPTRYHGSVPIVDRAKLAEIEARLLHAIVDRDSDPDFDVWGVPSNPESPPKVTEIPRASSKRRPKTLPPPIE